MRKWLNRLPWFWDMSVLRRCQESLMCFCVGEELYNYIAIHQTETLLPFKIPKRHNCVILSQCSFARKPSLAAWKLLLFFFQLNYQWRNNGQMPFIHHVHVPVPGACMSETRRDEVGWSRESCESAEVCHWKSETIAGRGGVGFEKSGKNLKAQ